MSLNATGATQPPKPWVKLNATEKIERIRSQVKKNNSLITDLRIEVRDLKEKLFKHRHDKNGELIQRMSEHQELRGTLTAGVCGPKNEEEVYF